MNTTPTHPTKKKIESKKAPIANVVYHNALLLVFETYSYLPNPVYSNSSTASDPAGLEPKKPLFLMVRH